MIAACELNFSMDKIMSYIISYFERAGDQGWYFMQYHSSEGMQMKEAPMPGAVKNSLISEEKKFDLIHVPK